MKRLSIFITTLLCWPQPLLGAASVFRCSDAEGNVSFNQHGCPPGQSGRTTSHANAQSLEQRPDTERMERLVFSDSKMGKP